jgi:hypothetical protein
MSFATKYAMQKRGGECSACGGKGCKMCHGGYAEGGEVEDDDIVGSIMRKRKGTFEDEPTADFEDADYSLPDDDHADAEYTDKNSGDEDGEPHEDMDDEDVVTHIMRKRRERNPRPA